ncbi:hypothetical protein LA52FAK_08580 [Desulforhopalus sp. 52FAK]
MYANEANSVKSAIPKGDKHEKNAIEDNTFKKWSDNWLSEWLTY